MYLPKYLYKFFLLAGLQVLFWSCKVAGPVTLPMSRALPGTFGTSADTTSTGNIAWSAFFTDPNLVSLIDTALRQNPDLQVTLQRVEMARAGVLQSKGTLMPAVQAEASARFDKYGDYTLNGVGNYDTNLSPNINENQKIPDRVVPEYFLGVRSTWELDIWGKLRNYRKAAYNRYLASENGRQLVQTALVAEVANLYYELVALDNELEIIDRNLSLQQLAIDLIKIKKAGGRETELAVQQSTAQLLNTQSLQAEKKRQITATENLLNQLLGRFPQPITRGKSVREQQLPENMQTGIPTHLLRRRPDIQQAEWELAAAKADVAAARAAFLPSFTISPYAGLNAFKASLLMTTPASLAYGLLGGLSLPIFSQNQLKARHRYASAATKEAFFNYQKSIFNGVQEVATGLNAIQRYKEIQELKAQEVTTLQDAITTSNDLFRAGYATYLEIITAQKGALAAELELINIHKARLLSTVDLYRALGGGWQ
ncbi:RND transporter [Adhaeribacter aerolatus]|uniref:RND transporter n=1 Tax=Adhaeribacter aerolatus TaxID=670289 RepID=A0A512ATQ7_9BACT|nr:efflux transporter outer membrane subunit [Adhaeribacter aerolatus]GEO03099.1 RND transporter [Adhaeribacter aerolatus]